MIEERGIARVSEMHVQVRFNESAAIFTEGLKSIVDKADALLASMDMATMDEALALYHMIGQAGIAAYRVQCAASHRLLTLAEEASVAQCLPIRGFVDDLCRKTGIKRTQLYDDALVHRSRILTGSDGEARTPSLDQPTYYREAVHTPDPAVFLDDLAARKERDGAMDAVTARALAKQYRQASDGGLIIGIDPPTYLVTQADPAASRTELAVRSPLPQRLPGTESVDFPAPRIVQEPTLEDLTVTLLNHHNVVLKLLERGAKRGMTAAEMLDEYRAMLRRV